MAPLWFWVLFAFLGLQRLGELLYSRHTARRLTREGARWVRADGYGLIVTTHALLLVATAAEAYWAPWAATGWWTILGALLFATGELFRYSSMFAMGWRWSTRVYSLPNAALVARGPYRFLRHPIYVGVTMEVAGLPLMGGLWVTLAVTSTLNAIALLRRIRIEERALGMA